MGFNNAPHDFTQFSQSKQTDDSKKTIINVQTDNSPSPLSAICHVFLMIGSILTFIRNTVFNIIFIILIIAIFAIISFSSNFSKTDLVEYADSSDGVLDTQIHSVLYFDLNGPIYEYSLPDDEYSKFSRKLEEKLNKTSTNDILSIEKALKLAATKSEIKVVYFDLSLTRSSLAVANRIAEAIKTLKKANPAIETIAFGNSYSASAYKIASACDKITLDPFGDFEFKGLSANSLYFKDLLDNLQIEPMIFKAGEFKSATEPFVQNQMSEPVKEEYQYVFNSLWEQYKNSLNRAKAEHAISYIFDDPDHYISFLKSTKGNPAMVLKRIGLVDKLESQLDLNMELCKKYGKASSIFTPKVTTYQNLLSIVENAKLLEPSTQNTKYSGTIAVMYGIGQINDYGDEPTDFTPENIQSQIEQILKIKNLKSVIFYINSPGGSVTASEKIRQLVVALKRTKHVPVYISMNSLAASGAYWISTAGTKVFASNDSITGSIGVFSLGFSAHELLNNIGVHQDGVQTSELTQTSIAKAMPESQKMINAMQVGSIYTKFISLVKGTRTKLRNADYKVFAEGRIFTAPDALRLGLVDRLASFNNVIAYAKNQIKPAANKQIKIQHLSAKPQSNANLLRNLFVSKASLFVSDEYIKFGLDLFKQMKTSKVNSQKVLAIGPLKSVEI